jgi:hypothetical protein
MHLDLRTQMLKTFMKSRDMKFIFDKINSRLNINFRGGSCNRNGPINPNP